MEAGKKVGMMRQMRETLHFVRATAFYLSKEVPRVFVVFVTFIQLIDIKYAMKSTMVGDPKGYQNKQKKLDMIISEWIENLLLK